MFRLSPRSWLILAVTVVAFLALVALLSFPAAPSGDSAFAPPPRPATPLPDAPLPGGGTARLSKCGVDDGPRPAALGEGERGLDPRLVLRGWGAYDPGSKAPGRPRFTVHATVGAEDRALLLDAPVAQGRVTLDIHGPHGEGRRASARGLTATVVHDGHPAEPVKTPASGSFRVDPGEELRLEVELPADALCPGYALFDVGRCFPADTNDAANCPVVTLTLSDPAIRAHRAAVTGRNPATPSDRLVAVSLEPEISRA
ncbi:hypothetical protein [Streptomyces vilmorinianum]|uniref:hypothetical protein n=1 Tax=Streptomyces vilmorinianum TaxID=3051092 RepID=UPI0010FB1FDE|nr:hypothetical protein [Streptomyces vilmorinianum]